MDNSVAAEMNFLAEFVRAAVIQSTEDGDDSYCVTLSRKDEETKWLQLKGSLINMSYPHAVEPNELFAELKRELPPSIKLDCWEPKLYVTFDFLIDDEITELDAYSDVADFLLFCLQSIVQVGVPVTTLQSKSDWL